MRRTGKAMMVAAAAMSFALTGCTSGTTSDGASPGLSGGSGAVPTLSPSGGAAGTGTAAACLVGDWKTTKLDGKLSGNGIDGSVTGGNGVAVSIAADGTTKVTFDGMQPVNFTVTIVGGNLAGSFFYGGAVDGTVNTPASDTGTWQPVGNVDFGSLNVTVDVTSPLKQRVADKVKLSQFVGGNTANTGNAVDAQPILRKMQYTCSGNTLTLAPPAGTVGMGTWTLTKA
jgi:hypothetical protein